MSSAKVIVAIDGPSGVGKSTASRLVANRLGIPHIDTGAMYRALAVKARREGVAFDHPEALASLAAGTTIEFGTDGERLTVLLDGENVTEEIRRPEASMSASTISAVPEVRRILVRLQQELGHKSGGVLEGRDIGTKVFPETPHKFFLSASPEVRAERRFRELEARNSQVTFARVLAELNDRDRQDSTRSDSPLRYDPSYRLIDTSDLTIDQVVDQIVTQVSASLLPAP